MCRQGEAKPSVDEDASCIITHAYQPCLLLSAGQLTLRAEALPGASSVPGSRTNGWQVSQAYTVRACMSQVLMWDPHLPHVP